MAWFLPIKLLTDFDSFMRSLISWLCFFLNQESLKKFRDEAEKLEQSESLKKAREKYVSEMNSWSSILFFHSIRVLFNKTIKGWLCGTLGYSVAY